MKFLFITCLVLFGTASFADVQIYLYSSASKSEDKLKIKDIARVDGPDEERRLCEEIEIDDAILADAYIDRRELSLLFGEKLNSSFVIYGSSVRIYEAASRQGGVSVKNGERIKVFVKRKNITIELTGVAKKDAADGECIVVRCGKKELSGIVKNKTVTCEL